MLYSGLTFETAWLLLTFCHVPAVDFLMAQLYPTCSAGPLAVFDAAVERCARVVLGGAGPAIFDHPLIRRRVRLPIRRNGFGLRARAETAPAAFCGRVLAVAAAMFEVAPETARDVFGVSKLVSRSAASARRPRTSIASHASAPTRSPANGSERA